MQRKQISFKGQKIFIGIDVHKDSWRVAAAPEVGVIKGHSQKPSAKELFDFLEKHYPDGDYHAVYESGFSGFSTYYALEEAGIQSIVIHAADVPSTQYEETMKTDKVDATKLARSLKAGLLRGIYIHRKDDLDARSVVRMRKTIQQQLGACKSRLKHLLLCNGVQLPERFLKPGTHWSRAFLKWLKEDVKLLSATRGSLDLQIEQVEQMRATLLDATRKVRRLSRSERYKADYDLVTSIPGIGMGVAMTLLTEIGDFNRFQNEREFASYLGLIPTSHSSGDKVAHGEKTFRGNKNIGAQIVEAAWVSISIDRGLGCAYFNYKKKMEPQKAIIRIARRLSNIILSVLKNRKRYEPYHWDE
jgi:transposase